MRFNRPVTVETTTNYEGEKAYALPAAIELYSAVVTSMTADTFYEKFDTANPVLSWRLFGIDAKTTSLRSRPGDRLTRIRELVARTDATFVGKLAVYAREQMYLRSMPVVLAVELAKVHSGDSLVSKVVDRVVRRADELTEMLAYYQIANNRTGTKKLGKLSKQIQKGLARAFNRFDAYQFAKYNRRAEIKLRDALFLVHPNAKSAQQQALFDQIASDTLATPDTWEVKLSESGKTEERSKKQVWEEMIEGKKMGYMATLRNLRNFIQAGVSSQHLTEVAAYLSRPDAVRQSKQFPFRFLAAYRELEKVEDSRFIGVEAFETGELMAALESAVLLSAEHIKGFSADTKVFISCDMSGSMDQPLSSNSSMRLFEVGLVLAMLLKSRCTSTMTSIFGTEHKVVSLPGKNILGNARRLRQLDDVGWSTNGYLAIRYLLDHRIAADKVMVFTDCQLWNSQGDGDSFNGLWKRYKAAHPQTRLYLFDLAGYGNTPTSILDEDVFFVSGWSEKVFDMFDALENAESIVKEIEKIQL